MLSLTAVSLSRPIALYPTDALIERALDMAVDLRHPVYDCLYLSLAVLRRARMVTADDRFARKAQSRPTYVRHIVLLKDMAH